MVKLIRSGVYYSEGCIVKENAAFMVESKKRAAVKSTLTYNILKTHGAGDAENIYLKFDSLVSGCETEQILGAICLQGLENFTVPYVFSGKSECSAAAKKFGCVYVPAHLASVNAYFFENKVSAGSIVLTDCGSGLGAMGAMAVKGSISDFVNQLNGGKFEIKRPETVAVYLKGKPPKGVGPIDVALEIISATLGKGFVKGKILEFVGPGIKNISMDFRRSVDELMHLTGCLSTVWETDEISRTYFKTLGRESDFKPLCVSDPAFYDYCVMADLSRTEPMVAVSSALSGACTVREYIQKTGESGRVKFTRGFVGGAAGANYESIAEAAEILRGKNTGEFYLNVSPDGSAVFKAVADNGYVSALLGAGAAAGGCADNAQAGSVIKTCLCGCESFVFADARTVCATAANGGVLIPATEIDYIRKIKKFTFDCCVYGGIGVNSDKSCGCIELPDDLFKTQLKTELAQNILLCYNGEGDYSSVSVNLKVKDNSAYLKAIGTDKRCGFNVCGAENIGAAISFADYDMYTVSKLTDRGILPLVCRKTELHDGDYLYIENIRGLIEEGGETVPVKLFTDGKVKNIMLDIAPMSADNKKILLAGGIFNYISNNK